LLGYSRSKGKKLFTKLLINPIYSLAGEGGVIGENNSWKNN
jgi:hypothetical protein